MLRRLALGPRGILRWRRRRQISRRRHKHSRRLADLRGHYRRRWLLAGVRRLHRCLRFLAKLPRLSRRRRFLAKLRRLYGRRRFHADWRRRNFRLQGRGNVLVSENRNVRIGPRNRLRRCGLDRCRCGRRRLAASMAQLLAACDAYPFEKLCNARRPLVALQGETLRKRVPTLRAQARQRRRREAGAQRFERRVRIERMPTG